MEKACDDGGVGARWEHVYLAIDLKSFYASVECADRGLDPMEARLVVADPSRSANTICLAVSPAMKRLGVRNRCRMRDIPAGLHCKIARPRMARYIEVSKRIYSIYLRYFAREDTWPYSVDELFIDATPYRGVYGADARALAARMITAVKDETGIPATAGIGENLFLCKVALDLGAKHAPDGIGVLDRRAFLHEVWFHRPITDIWGIGPGISRRLAAHGATDLCGACGLGPKVMKREFGRDGTWLLDHAWGLEPATIADCRGYVPKGRSISQGQVLMRDYGAAEARTVLLEMAQQACLDLRQRRCRCTGVSVWAGYSGWDVPGAGRSRKLGHETASEREIASAALALYGAAVDPGATIRRLGVCLTGLVPEAEASPTLFDDQEAEGREAALARSVLACRKRFGPNAVVAGTSLRPEANALERNLMIGGHHA